MEVVRILPVIAIYVAVSCQGAVVGQFTAAAPACPGDTFTFQCTVGDTNGITIWRVGGTKECTLLHSTASAPGPCGSGSLFTVTTGTGFGTRSTSFTSTLSSIASPTLNGTLVECFGPFFSRVAENMVGSSTFQILDPPTVSILNHSLSELSDGTVNVIMSWTLSDGDSADFFLINITTNALQTPYGGLLNITTASVTEYELTGFVSGYEYNITVCGVNCGSQEGRESEPLRIRPQVPDAPADCHCSTVYSQSSGILLFINSIWDIVQDPPNPCTGVTGSITEYQISFKMGLFVAIENVNTARCINGGCSHTFEPHSNPPSSYSYDRVSVAAENVVGVGPARNCTTQTIITTNNLLNGEVAGVSSPSDANVICTFLPGFNGSAHCTVQYGTDPTYMNLPYSAESTETGTAGDSVSVVLRERLNSSTVYYYTVSAVSGDIRVTVRAPPFITPEYTTSTHLNGGIGHGGECLSVLVGIFVATSSTLLHG